MSDEPTTSPRFTRLVLTTEQQSHVRASVGLRIEEVVLSVQELEERIVPLPMESLS